MFTSMNINFFKPLLQLWVRVTSIVVFVVGLTRELVTTLIGRDNVDQLIAMILVQVLITPLIIHIQVTLRARTLRTILAVRILLCNYLHLTGVFAFLYYNIFRLGLSVHIGKINYNISHPVHVKSSLYTKALYISATLSFTQFAIFWQIKNKRLRSKCQKFGVPPIRIVKSNVTRSVDPSSEKNI